MCNADLNCRLICCGRCRLFSHHRARLCVPAERVRTLPARCNECGQGSARRFAGQPWRAFPGLDPGEDQRVAHVQADTDLKRREITDDELSGGAFGILRFKHCARREMDAAIDLRQQ